LQAPTATLKAMAAVGSNIQRGLAVAASVNNV